jgi:lipoprotein-anchoring transpeptidase ErfK/SrfK
MCRYGQVGLWQRGSGRSGLTLAPVWLVARRGDTPEGPTPPPRFTARNTGVANLRRPDLTPGVAAVFGHTAR